MHHHRCAEVFSTTLQSGTRRWASSASWRYGSASECLPCEGRLSEVTGLEEVERSRSQELTLADKRSGTYLPSSRPRRVADLGQFKANRAKRLGVRSRKPLKNKTLQMQGPIEAGGGGGPGACRVAKVAGLHWSRTRPSTPAPTTTAPAIAGAVKAERGGFEPPWTLRPNRISNPAHSTALPPLHAGCPAGRQCSPQPPRRPSPRARSTARIARLMPTARPAAGTAPSRVRRGSLRARPRAMKSPRPPAPM